MANQRKKRSSRLDVSASHEIPDIEELPERSFFSLPDFQIPIWWINTLIGIFLLPVAGIWTQTFFTGLTRETMANGFWASEEFWFFGLGVVLWVIAFFGLPRPVLIYVFGHELTHAIWVWLMGGRVSTFKFGSDGGHIITDKHNFWIALAPYFYPIYSILLVIVYGFASMVWDLSPYHRLFFALLGVTWAFHISFTLWMIPKGQSDLSYHGTFFSLVVIYLFNLILLTLLLILASPHVTCLGFGRELLANTIRFSSWTWALIKS